MLDISRSATVAASRSKRKQSVTVDEPEVCSPQGRTGRAGRAAKRARFSTPVQPNAVSPAAQDVEDGDAGDEEEDEDEEGLSLSFLQYMALQ